MKIQRLLLKGVIAHSVHEEGEFISSIFVRPKKDGSYRMILNLTSSISMVNTIILRWTQSGQQYI